MGHQIRIGTDIVELAEIDRSLASFGARFLHNIFTDAEVAACDGPARVPRLAARFAAKEAAIKAFGEPSKPFVPREIEVVTYRHLPSLRLTGSAKQMAAEQGWQDVSVSLTHADCHAAAVVAVVCRVDS